MENKRKQIPPPLSPVWSIWVPLGIVLAALLGMMILTVLGGANHNPQVAQWSAISVIFLILPMLAGGLVLLALLLAIVYGLHLLQHHLPGWMQTAQAFTEIASIKVKGVADSIVKPFLDISSHLTKVKYSAEKIKKDTQQNKKQSQ